MKASQIAFAMAMSGIASATLAHYAEAWIVGYGVALMSSLIAAAIFHEAETR